MTNLEYLKSIKMRDRFFDDGDKYKYRKVKALEIIAEELCIMNNPLVKVTMLKPKIQLPTKEEWEANRKPKGGNQ